MLRRSAQMRFGGGSWAFPGGHVDPEDAASAHSGLDRADIDTEDAAARVAAIRETIEEAGLAIGLSPPPTLPHIATIRAGLAAKQAMETLAADGGYRLDLSALIPFARWIPFEGAPRRFDTRFYLVEVPDGHEAVADGTEADAACWVSAADALDRAAAGDMAIMFPTRCNLVRLAPYGSIAEAFSASHALPVRALTTFIEVREGVRHICVPDGHGYPALSEAIPTAPRPAA